jgi:hypothetical protein
LETWSERCRRQCRLDEALATAHLSIASLSSKAKKGERVSKKIHRGSCHSRFYHNRLGRQLATTTQAMRHTELEVHRSAGPEKLLVWLRTAVGKAICWSVGPCGRFGLDSGRIFGEFLDLLPSRPLQLPEIGSLTWSKASALGSDDGSARRSRIFDEWRKSE